MQGSSGSFQTDLNCSRGIKVRCEKIPAGSKGLLNFGIDYREKLRNFLLVIIRQKQRATHMAREPAGNPAKGDGVLGPLELPPDILTGSIIVCISISFKGCTGS